VTYSLALLRLRGAKREHGLKQPRWGLILLAVGLSIVFRLIDWLA
jgi:hypothetical protein